MAGPDWVRPLLGPAGPEIGCDACFRLLDRYVDASASGRDADADVPGMREHLQGCPACREEYESLVALVAEDDAPTAPAHEALEALRRWEDTGGTWRALRVDAAGAEVELCTCSGEPMGRLSSDHPDFVRAAAAGPDAGG